MSYFNLRKRDPETEPEEAEPEEGDTTEEAASAAPQGIAGALWAGISGPGRWLTAHGRPGLAWLLYGGSAWAFGFYGGRVAVGLAAFWLLAFLAFTPREFKERAAAAIERFDSCRQPDPTGETEARESRKHGPEDVYAATLEWVWRQLGDAQGVHLRDLLKHAQEHGMFETLDVAAFRTHLERWGIPIRNRCRARGKGVTVGIHREDLKPLLAAPSPTATPDPPNSGLHPA